MQWSVAAILYVEIDNFYRSNQIFAFLTNISLTTIVYKPFCGKCNCL